uniref:MYC binding protein n=1 Tax=Salvator merianae TaxID=96440 RepID=A0A8D0AZD5_SALMN
MRHSARRRGGLRDQHLPCESSNWTFRWIDYWRGCGGVHINPLPSGNRDAWVAHFWAADSKREQFRRYLEKSGVMDTLTKVLVALYEEPEKPNCALDFLKHHLGAAAPENPEVEALRLEVAEMKEKYEAVLEENKKLKAKLAALETPQEEKRE